MLEASKLAGMRADVRKRAAEARAQGAEKYAREEGGGQEVGARQDTPPIIAGSQMFAFEHFAVCFARRLRKKNRRKNHKK